MHMFEAIDLARFQFAFVVSFHIIFPAFTIGLASYLAVLEGLWLWKRDCLLYTSPSPRDVEESRMPSSA